MAADPSYWVYFLVQGRCSYIGSTNDPRRRLRQHRGELVGGAKYTTRLHPGPWAMMMRLGPFDRVTALQWEWQARHHRLVAALPGVHRRASAYLATCHHPRLRPRLPEISVVIDRRWFHLEAELCARWGFKPHQLHWSDEVDRQ